MTVKDKDRRTAYWVSFIYICISPLMVKLGADIEIVKSSSYALTTLGIANYFSKPTGDE